VAIVERSSRADSVNGEVIAPNATMALGLNRRRYRAPAIKERFIMASVCEICGKKPSFGMNVSFSHRRTKRLCNPNIQHVRAVVNGTPKHMNVCTGCIRSGKVTKRSRRKVEA
jgi:large subunit ribosomal protein L28